MPPSPSANRFFDAHTFNSVPCFRPFVIESYVKWNHRFGFNEERPETDDEEPPGDRKPGARNAPSGEAPMAPGEVTARKTKKARGVLNGGGGADEGDDEEEEDDDNDVSDGGDDDDDDGGDDGEKGGGVCPSVSGWGLGLGW